MAMKIDLAQLFEKIGGVETYDAGAIVFRQGDPGSNMYVVKSGTVSVAVDGKQVATLRDGDIFGEMALIDKSPRSATVTASSDCALVPLDEKRFLYMVHETPYFSLDVMKVIANRLRTMNRLL